MNENNNSYPTLAGAFTAEQLMYETFPPVDYAVPGIVPEGLTLLVAPPKIGKSWMVLAFAVASAVGGRALQSIQVRQRPVLYLALEDGPRRLQSRLQRLGVAIGAPGLTFMTDVPAGAHATISAYLDLHEGQRPLVIVDTLGKIKDVYNGNDSYGADYKHTASLKALADGHPGSALLVVHHTRKGQSSDFVDTVSGTQGIAGAADTILTLQRDRNDGQAILNVTSRDAAEGQYGVTFSEGTWTLEGSSLAEAAQAVQQREATDGVGDDMAAIINAVNAYPDGVRRQQLVDLLGIDSATVGTYLRRAVDANRISNPSRGLYTPVTTVTSVTSTEGSAPNETHMTVVTGTLGTTEEAA